MKYNLLEHCALCLIHTVAKIDCTIAIQRYQDLDELTVIVAPVVLGAGKRLFDGFTQSLDLQHLWVRQSPFATFIHYRVKR